MRSVINFSNIIYNKLQAVNVTAVLLFLFIVLIIPFFIISLFNIPSLDDYDFAVKTIRMGYWNAQISAYHEWNGRYFASLVLLAHPLAFHSFALYKVIPMILLILTTHSIFYFITKCFSLENVYSRLALSLLVVFYFLNNMPSLAQGIYWEPSAITYHLANIMLLYLLANLFVLSRDDGKKNIRLKIVSALLVLAIIGSNETTMILLNLILISIIGYFLIFERKLEKLTILYLILAFAGTAVLVSSPGSAIRESNVIHADKHNIVFTILSSFEAMNRYSLRWILSAQNMITSILFVIICLNTTRKIKISKAFLYFILIIIGGYLLVSATFSSGFWSISDVAPDRAVNVVYWIFILFWFTSLYFISLLIVLWRPSWGINKNKPIILLLTAGFLFTINSLGNYYNVCKDLTGNKAYIYNKEHNERIEMIKACKFNICEVPSFSVAPKSLFVDDLKTDPKNWGNCQFANYFEKQEVKATSNTLSISACTYLVNYDTDEPETLRNAERITNKLFFSPPHSSLQSGKNTNSAVFEKKMKDLEIDDPSEVIGVEISAQIHATDSIPDALLVFCIIEPVTDKVVFWTAKNIDPKAALGVWRKESFAVLINRRSFLEPENKMLVYLWNIGNGKVYMDDLTVSVY